MASMGRWGLSRSQRFVFGDHALAATQLKPSLPQNQSVNYIVLLS